MASYKNSAEIRRYTASADQTSGTIVQSADGLAGYVEAQRGIKNGEVGIIRIAGILTCDKASATVIAAGDRLQIATATQLVTVKASGAADASNILIGRAATAAGNGTLTVEVDLNRAAV
jgi:hypothetical protein